MKAGAVAAMVLALCLSAHAETVPLSSLDLTKARQGWGKPSVDHSVTGKKLCIGGKEYAHGFGTHAVSSLYIALKGASASFSALVGVDDEHGEGTGAGSVVFVVIGDGKELFRSGVHRGGDSAEPVSVSTKGVNTLELRVEDAGDGNGADHADWAEAQFEVAGARPETTAPPALPDRWVLAEGGIEWRVAADRHLPHEDHVEMSGRGVSLIVRYGVDGQKHLQVARTLVWPTLRTIPNDTHASLMHDYGMDVTPQIKVDGVPLSPERPRLMRLDGALTIVSVTDQQLQVTRTIFPTTRCRVAMERWSLHNATDKPMRLEIAPLQRTDHASGVYGEYVLEVTHDAPATTTIAPGATLDFGVSFSGRKAAETAPRLDVVAEEAKRREFVASLRQALRLETPDATLNQAFDFAKLRAAESIFDTKGGLMHCPGGGSYYAAVWTNDQVEYAGPLFPFLGDEGGNDASLNAYRLYVHFMKPEYRMIPTSIIAEGTDIWEGAGDRGDAAMYAYGASRFCLARGDRKIAEELWPAIEWCLEYCKRQTTAEGVIASNSDELEGRFPTGKANLSTSTLAYGGLRSAADLARALGKPDAANDYDARAAALAKAIEAHFGANVEGFATYRYYDGNTVLRSWICLPLCMGVADRRAGTIAALFSPRLWTADGLATQAGETTFWDRSTLYGFRGVLAAGETATAMKYLTAYTRRRLLGEHVPYPVEAYPEGGQRHLSAESALYCRVFTEGLFGITPVGLNAFRCTPRLPQGWNRMALRSIRAFGHDFDLEVHRTHDAVEVVVTSGGRTVTRQTVPTDGTIHVTLQ